MSNFQAIADFFRTLYRVSFKPQEVYRELASDPARRRQGRTLALVAPLIFPVLLVLSSGLLAPSSITESDVAVFLSMRASFGAYAIIFFFPGLIVQLLTLDWIALRVFPSRAVGWPALGLSLSPGFLVGGASFLLWLLAFGLGSTWIYPLVFLSLGAFSPILFTLAFLGTYAYEHQQLVARMWTEDLVASEQEFWYWIPFLVIMAGLALWQGWLIYQAARELGDNQQPYLAGLILFYTLMINLPVVWLMSWISQILLYWP